MNKLITIFSFTLAVPSFVAVFHGDKKAIIISGVIAFLLCISFFWLESVIKKNGSKISNALAYFFQRVDGTYYILEQKYVYERIDAENWEFTKKYCLMSRNNTFDNYDDRFCWSADSSKATIDPLEPKHVVKNVRNEDIWTAFTVKFDTVHKRKEISTGTKITNLVDSAHTVRPFLSNRILRKTRLLRMSVIIPKEFMPKNPRIEIFTDDIQSSKISSEPLNYNEKTHEIEAPPIEFPRVGWVYSIIWEN